MRAGDNKKEKKKQKGFQRKNKETKGERRGISAADKGAK